MNKQQFLNDLRNQLEGEVPQEVINENIAYYGQYFDEQMQQGRAEEDVLAELGSAVLVARSIIDASTAEHSPYYDDQVYTEDGDESADDQDPQFKVVNIKWYHKILFAVILVAVIALIFTIAGAMITIFAPILLVLLFVYVIRTMFFR